jgi:putative permease
MKTWFDPHLRRDLLKLACVVAALLGTVAIFFVTPALSTPTFLSVVITMLLSPLVAALERRGYPRWLSITILFLAIGGAFASGGLVALQSGEVEWSSFKEKAPQYFDSTIQKIRGYEVAAKARYPFLSGVNPTDAIIAWGKETGAWFVKHGPALAGELLTWFFIVPFITFVMLNEGPAIRRRFFQLVPNRFFEVTFLATNDILTSIADYLRAKLVEAGLVGLMTGVGLAAVGAPYSIVLGIVAGVTNIVPYLGPVLGAVPGLLVVAFDPATQGLLLPVAMIYVIANVIDMVLIFPLVVAKLVNLHPLLLIAVVVVGQQYYGLVGMLISIPIASALKVVLQEIYSAVYEHRTRGRSEVAEEIDGRGMRLGA